MSGFSIFDISGSGMRSQMLRLGTTASNIANGGTVAGSEASAYRAIHPVFQPVSDENGNSMVVVSQVSRSQTAPEKSYDPSHPLADGEGFVWKSTVDNAAEIVDMIDASRQFQNNVLVLQTARDLIVETIRS